MSTIGPRSILAARRASVHAAPVRGEALTESWQASAVGLCRVARRVACWIYRRCGPSAEFADGSLPAPPRWERRRCWPSLRSERIVRRLAPRRERARIVNRPRSLTWD